MKSKAIKTAGVVATGLIVALALSGCTALRDACRPEQLVPAPGGGFRVIPGECPR